MPDQATPKESQSLDESQINFPSSDTIFSKPLISQAVNPKARGNWPAWARELPSWRTLKSNDEFSLLNDKQKLANILKAATPATKARIEQDIQTLENVMRDQYVAHDRTAKRSQNRYRANQITLISLAFFATILGSIQAWFAGQDSDWLRVFSVLETIIAAFTTFVAVGMTTYSPLTDWINERKMMERLRQEYFRFLMYQPPYEETSVGRDNRLNERVSQILAGKSPADSKTSMPQSSVASDPNTTGLTSK